MKDDTIKNTLTEATTSFLLTQEIVFSYLWPLMPRRGEKLNQSQVSVLRELRAYKKMNLTQLATQVSVTNQSMTTISNFLVKKDYVERIYDDSNRRQIELILTEKGLTYITKYDEEILNMIIAVFSLLSEKDLIVLQKASNDINIILGKTAFSEKFENRKDFVIKPKKTANNH